MSFVQNCFILKHVISHCFKVQHFYQAYPVIPTPYYSDFCIVLLTMSNEQDAIIAFAI